MNVKLPHAISRVRNSARCYDRAYSRENAGPFAMTADMFKVIATFEDADGKPLSGADYMVRLLDKDRFFDDKLGSSSLGANGLAEFLIFVADIKSIDSADERAPDIYFVVTRGGQEIFRSEIFPDVNFDATNPVTGRPDGLTKTFGPFRITEQTRR